MEPQHKIIGSVTRLAYHYRLQSMEQGNTFAPICLSVHRGRCLVPGWPGPRGYLVLGGCLLLGVSGLGSACSGGRGYGTGGLVPGGACCCCRHPPMATSVGSTHPTGMHSCFYYNCHLLLKSLLDSPPPSKNI